MGLFGKKNIISGKDVAKGVSGMSTKCSSCGNLINFSQGVQMAKSNNISDDVIMCDKCRSIFTVDIDFGRNPPMKIKEDVTSKYR